MRRIGEKSFSEIESIIRRMKTVCYVGTSGRENEGRNFIFEFRAEISTPVCPTTVMDFKLYFRIWAALAQEKFPKFVISLFSSFRTYCNRSSFVNN